MVAGERRRAGGGIRMTAQSWMQSNLAVQGYCLGAEEGRALRWGLRFPTALCLGLVILGLGQGSAFTTMYAATSTGVAPEHQGIGSGTASTGQQLGNAVGLAVLVAVANQPDAVAGLRTTVLLTAAGVAVTAAVALTGRRTQTLALSN